MPHFCRKFLDGQHGHLSLDVARLANAGAVGQIVAAIYPQPSLKDMMGICCRCAAIDTAMPVPRKGAFTKVVTGQQGVVLAHVNFIARIFLTSHHSVLGCDGAGGGRGPEERAALRLTERKPFVHFHRRLHDGMHLSSVLKFDRRPDHQGLPDEPAIYLSHTGLGLSPE